MEIKRRYDVTLIFSRDAKGHKGEAIQNGALSNVNVEVHAQYRDGVFYGAIIKTDNIFNTTFYIDGVHFKLLRDLFPEIVTALNNPPVGCEPI